jgi:hypothetical protein
MKVWQVAFLALAVSFLMPRYRRTAIFAVLVFFGIGL